jgi:hypothetical protein
MAHQVIEAHGGAALPTCIWVDEVRDRTQRFFSGGVLGELFAIIVGQSLDHGRDRFETSAERRADVISCLARNFGEDGVAALRINHADDRLLVTLANYGVEFPVVDDTPRFDMPRAVGNRPESKDLPSTISRTCIAIGPLLSRTKMLEERATRVFVRIDSAINRFEAYATSRSDLLRAPFVPE